MGVLYFETYLRKSRPGSQRLNVNVRSLAEEYTLSTGKQPVIVLDGRNCLRGLLDQQSNEWVMGGQVKAFVWDMQYFVSKFQEIGVKLVFFFDGATQEDKRQTWLRRRNDNIKKVVRLFKNLGNRNLRNLYTMPPVLGAVGCFAAKFECECEVHMSLMDCDAEMAAYARTHDCLAIVSRDTDFVFLEGARNYLPRTELNIETMEAVAYNREGLQAYLGLEHKQLLLLATLIGNDFIPQNELNHFQRRVCPSSTDMLDLVPCLVKYIKQNYNSESCEVEDEDLCHVALDAFGDETRVRDLSESIRRYLPASTEDSDQPSPSKVAKRSSQKRWQRILNVARVKHVTCSVTTHMYPVMMGQAFELSTALEDYDSEIPCTAALYRPLRQRIYGILLQEKPGASTVDEWCIGSNKAPNEALKVPIIKPEEEHQGLLHLWDESCLPATRWRLFVRCLTRNNLDADRLQKLGFPFAVPVAVIHYLQQEYLGFLSDTDVDVLLAQAAKVRYMTAEELADTRMTTPVPYVVYLSTIFHRGVATILFLLSACGFSLDEAMPWFYFDGKMLLQKYVEANVHGILGEDLCNDQNNVLKSFRKMKRLLNSV